MTTEAIKNAILAEMAEGKSLLEARIAVMSNLSDRVDVASSEIKTDLGY